MLDPDGYVRTWSRSAERIEGYRGGTDDHTFEIAYEGLQDGKPYRETAAIRVMPDDAPYLESTDYIDEELASITAVTLRKR